MLSYEICKKLKDTGWKFNSPKKGVPFWFYLNGIKSFVVNAFTPLMREDVLIPPTLSELIEACGELEELKHINRTDRDEWLALAIEQEPWNHQSNASGRGKTPEEAVANLYLSLNNGK